MGSIKSFRELDVWKSGIELVKRIYGLSHSFPVADLYTLVAQMRRSAISIPSNIAEGFRRRHPKEFRHSLNITLGSLAELETQVVIAKELNYLNEQTAKELFESIDHIARMTSNLIKRVNATQVAVRNTPYD